MTFLVTPCIVRSPVTSRVSASTALTEVLEKVRVGNFSTSKKSAAAQVVVAVGVVGVDGGRLDGEVDARRRRVLRVVLDGAVEVLEAAGHVGDEVADGEADAAVVRVHLVDGGLGRRQGRQQESQGKGIEQALCVTSISS